MWATRQWPNAAKLVNFWFYTKILQKWGILGIFGTSTASRGHIRLDLALISLVPNSFGSPGHFGESKNNFQKFSWKFIFGGFGHFGGILTHSAPPRQLPDTIHSPYRESLNTFHTPSRHLPDTLQKPSRHPSDTFKTPSRHPPDTHQAISILTCRILQYLAIWKFLLTDFLSTGWQFCDETWYL